MSRKTLLCLGFGFTARHLARALDRDEWDIIGTTRSADGMAAIADQDVTPIQWPGGDLTAALSSATHVLSSVPPRETGDPVHDLLRDNLDRLTRLEWLGLLSTTGVYGDHDGDWVDEDTPLASSGHRQSRRVVQDGDWMQLWRQNGLPVHIFRLAGIYGPGRSALDKVRDGTARRIVKPGQVFSRIHVDDIVQVLLASFRHPAPGRAYNLADDEPGPPQDVIAYAANLLNLPVPPAIPFEDADLSPMARTFYADNKRVRNTRMKEELGVRLIYPDYRTGLRAILAAERTPADDT